MRLILCLVATLLLFSCKEESNEILDLRTHEEKELVSDQAIEQDQVQDNVENDKPIQVQRNSAISFKIIENEYGFGYQIYDGDKLMINQPHIPAIQGMQGFESIEKAEIAAKYVVSEIDKGNFPPTVTEKILRDLGAL